MDTHCRTVTSGYTPSMAAPSYTCQRGMSHLHYFDLEALTMPLLSNQHFFNGHLPYQLFITFRHLTLLAVPRRRTLCTVWMYMPMIHKAFCLTRHAGLYPYLSVNSGAPSPPAGRSAATPLTWVSSSAGLPHVAWG